MTREQRTEMWKAAKDIAAKLWIETNDEKADALIVELRLQLTRAQLESLGQLAKNGPVWDGDVISNACRDELITLRLASRVLVKGQWGYTACTYLGGHVLNDRVETFS